jgi:tetraacyldisaccharide 4'-kinase
MFYSLFYSIAFCVAAPFLLLSPRSRNKYLGTFRRRLGFLPQPLATGGRPVLWVHAVSVGEALAARSLVGALRHQYPDHAILVSTTTTTGQEIARRELGADDVFYFPFDWKSAYRRILRGLDVRLCLAMETELWPNFTRVLNERRIPLLLVNGRISDRSFSGYRRHRWFFRPVLRRYHSLCAQSELDARRLQEIGARAGDVVVTGNLKYARGQFAVSPEKIGEVRSRLAVAPDDLLFVAGSTHEGEEKAALEAWRALLPDAPSLRLVLVPRKPERFGEVADLLQHAGISCHRWSEGADSAHLPVLLLDAVGHLTALYHLARVAFVGGSLIPRGGHNLLEASAAGVPVIFGPHMHNFRTVRDDVLRAGAGIEIQRPDDLVDALRRLLTDAALYEQTARGAREVIGLQQTALPKTMEVVNLALSGAGERNEAPAGATILAKLHAGAAAILRGDPKRELARAKRLPRPVVSIGGLAFGGSGKTPLVSMLASHLLAQNCRVAVLTRGYGGSGRQPLIVSDGAGLHADVARAGDEALMLAARHPGLIVIRDANRARAGALAMERFQPDIFLLDDGFQHRAIARDLNILALDADTVIGPRSADHLLREPLDFAGAADCIILRGDIPWRREAAIGELRSRFPAMDIFPAETIALSCRDLAGLAVPLEELAGLKLGAVSGIAAPARFRATLARLGVRPLFFRSFPDHHRFSSADLAELAALLPRHGADVMIATEKDEHRLAAAFADSAHPPRILILCISVRIEAAAALLDRVSALVSR